MAPLPSQALLHSLLASARLLSVRTLFNKSLAPQLTGSTSGVWQYFTRSFAGGREFIGDGRDSSGKGMWGRGGGDGIPRGLGDYGALEDVGKGMGGSVQSRNYSAGRGGEPGSQSSSGGSSPTPGSFGDLLAASGISDDALDSLIALKDFGGIVGLPPLELIEEEDEEREKKAMRRERERQKQEELAKTRVKRVDDLGRAYATGKRKTSIARVWLKEGEGKVIINGKPHDLYFPDVDNRVHFLEPFCETNTIGMFDVRSTVKGGGTTGQSGALRHGISKALQLFDPTLRPLLKTAGMLTRDSRVVERKKPGKAKARKSFQWVKR